MAVGTTRGKRRLGRFVKPIRQRSGRKPDEVAKLAVCSRQTVQRLESGDALPSLGRLSAILGVIGATDEERAHAEQLWQVANADTTTIQHAENLSAKYRRFRMDEAEAVKERTLDTVIVPGLLQTPEYAAEIARGRKRLDRSTDWEKHAGDERRDRQALLLRDRNPLVLHALIHEAALHTVVGGPEVMAAQLDLLITMSELPHVTIQIVPLDHGAHGAMTGPWFLLSFPEDDEPDSAYAESVTGLDTVEKPEDVAGLSDIWEAIAATAPSPQRSAEIIESAKGRGNQA
ncbi:helix-turn-helix domain-containing protein [Amycolatopsis cihanbeyliensis]|uniref:Helix-turn-helix protein n=1 Tax=Amycolatopsis cihanbeyliensis TaxID=1128664 RepID=A0A542DIP6_AMYCI|nr:helix-turn-helix transcriptional regulator [Amycolatopsis cihanbeyliensis]TQJ02864.1 helix-turn-helix protein [Amycolatopsis cihanbeyliensis]